MTFKHKLSVRLALLKDVLPLVSVVSLFAACEQPSPLGPTTTTNVNVSSIVTIPDSVTVKPGQYLQFAAYGRTSTRDSVAIAVTWQAVGGGVMSPDGLYTAGALQGDYAVVAKLVPPAAIGAPNMALPVRTSVVHVDPLAQIVVVPTSTSVVTGGTQQFAAYGRRSTGDSVALSVVWSATGGTISSSGLYTVGATPGGYLVTASADGLTGTATVTASSVPVASVGVSPASVAVSVGSAQQLTAVAKDASGNVLPGRTVTWATNSSAIATVSPSGLVSGVAVGSATITAMSEGKSGTAAVTVTNLPVASVTVSPSPASVYLGATVQVAATAKDANGNPLSGRAVTWTTSNGAVAAVDSTGLVSGIALGTATITATSEGQTGTATVTVSNVPVASVVVAPSAANILVGNTVQLTATVQDAAGTALIGRAITWSSSNPSIATVSSNGVTTAVAAGTATITATSEGKSASTTVTVANVPVASVVISPATALVLVGASVQLAASPKDAAGAVLSGRAITWASSAPATATVSSTGLVTGVAAGAVTITAMSEGVTGSAAVTVNVVPVASVSLSPATVSAAVGQAVQLTATPQDASGSPLSGRLVTWATSNAAVATVTASGQVTVGVVTGVAAGSAIITATSEGKSATATATVTLVPVASVSVTPAAATITAVSSQQLAAVTKDAAGNTLTGRIVTWVSSNPSVATVTSSGLVTGQLAGSATITATSETKSGTSAITVQAPPSGSHAGYYVTPSGSSSGNGSASQPWDLATALAGPAAVHPGDTIWVRGGTYNTGQLVSRLVGSVASPIVVRQFPGERATINTGSGDFTINGSDVWMWGFEVTNNLLGGYGIFDNAPRGKLINLVVHDARYSGIGFWQAAVDGEVYGCLVYNNGTRNNQDHGIYAQNTVGVKRLRDNIVFNNWSIGVQETANSNQADLISNIQFQGNVLWNSSLIGGAIGWDFLVGGGANTGPGIVVSDNYLYRTDGQLALDLGYTSTNNIDLVATNNHVGGGTIHVGPWSPILYSGNVAVTGSQSPPNRIVVRPNAYEAGRANIIVYNWAQQSTVSVDVSSVLNVGDNYVVKNAQDFYGPAVVTGTYTGAQLSLPTTAIAAPVPVGRGHAGPTTGPIFNVFVLLRTP